MQRIMILIVIVMFSNSTQSIDRLDQNPIDKQVLKKLLEGASKEVAKECKDFCDFLMIIVPSIETIFLHTKVPNEDKYGDYIAILERILNSFKLGYDLENIKNRMLGKVFNQSRLVEIESYQNTYHKRSFHNGIVDYIVSYVDRYITKLPRSYVDNLFNECLDKIFKSNLHRLNFINQLLYFRQLYYLIIRHKHPLYFNMPEVKSFGIPQPPPYPN